MLKIIVIAAGGALGSLVRYWLSGWCHDLVHGAFPLGTLVVNVLGCFLIGFLGAAFSGPINVPDHHRLGIMVGLLGGFTTFSAFGFETLNLMQNGKWVYAAANVGLTLFLALPATWVGYRLAQSVLSG